MAETELALELFLRWLNAEQGRHFQLKTVPEGAGVVASDGEASIAVEARTLLGPVEDGAWLAARDRLQFALSEAVPTAMALWLPGGAELPRDEPETSEFLSLVREAVLRLGPFERSYVPLPIRLGLRKASDTGGVVSAVGGLNAHWARFTERVQGTFDLDSMQLHRLPESEEHLERLIDTIAERAATMQPGQFVEIETVDAWTVQRLAGDRGATIIGVPPADFMDAGLLVRRNFRRVLADSAPRLREQEADARALLAIGYYPRMDQEGATTAMRGYDPMLYSGIDFICLVSDGLVKPLIASSPFC